MRVKLITDDQREYEAVTGEACSIGYGKIMDLVVPRDVLPEFGREAFRLSSSRGALRMKGSRSEGPRGDVEFLVCSGYNLIQIDGEPVDATLELAFGEHELSINGRLLKLTVAP